MISSCHGCAQNLPDFSYAGFAQALGFLGLRVETPDAIGAAWDRAFRADRPALLDVVTDRHVPMLPPHISWEQAKNFAKSTLAGDVDALGFLRQTAKELTGGVLGRAGPSDR